MSINPLENLKNRCLLHFLASHTTHLSYLLFRLPVLTSRKPQILAVEEDQENQITDRTQISKDLGADSLEWMDLIGTIEEKFGVTITEEDSASYLEGTDTTIGDILDLLKDKGVK